MSRSEDTKASEAEARDTVEVVLLPSTSELQKLAEAVEEFAASHGLSAKVMNTVALVLEEAVTNVLMYAFEGMPEESGRVSVRLQRTPEAVCATIVDNGHPFDPTGARNEAPDPNAEEKLGGWGIKLIRNLANEVRYRRIGNVNQLELVLYT
jgi:anti-sigma regulatory factor (Ser/Thr protein kinase)